jgi:cytochrome c oxidase subunit II
MWNFPLFPDQASSVAPEVDALLGFLLLITAFFSLLIAGLIIYLAVKYRHNSDADRSGGEESHLALELVWTVIPVVIVMFIFAWGVKLFYRIKVIPPNAIELFVVGKQWMWKVQHPEGPREINALHVPVGQAIQLTMISEDVIHSFYIPAFRIKQDVLPGRYVKQWFQATKTGTYHLFCAEYCGTLHAGMVGEVVVMEPKDYEAWLAGGGSSPNPMNASGSDLFKSMGCATCHVQTGEGRGPSLQNLFGSKVALDNGQTVVADEAYLRESILKGPAKVVRGYQPIMPTYQNQLSEQNVLDLITYIKTLKEKR